jgi:hypothetical protein
MSKHRRVTITTLVTALVMALTVVSIHTINAQSPEPLGIEIRTNASADTLYLPVALPTQKNRLYATVPVENGGEVSAVRIIPIMRGSRVRFEAYAVSGDLTKAQSCADRLLLPSKLIATRTVGKDEIAILSGEGWSATVKGVERRADPVSSKKQADGQASFIKTSIQQEPAADAGGCGCAGCAGGMRCCPNKGDCMQCTCGTVCCTGS